MIDAKYLFELDENSTVETIGRTVTADSLAGQDYTEGDYFGDENTPTYIIHGQNGDFIVKQSAVRTITVLPGYQKRHESIEKHRTSNGPGFYVSDGKITSGPYFSEDRAHRRKARWNAETDSTWDVYHEDHVQQSDEIPLPEDND